MSEESLSRPSLGQLLMDLESTLDRDFNTLGLLSFHEGEKYHNCGARHLSESWPRVKSKLRASRAVLLHGPRPLAHSSPELSLDPDQQREQNHLINLWRSQTLVASDLHALRAVVEASTALGKSLSFSADEEIAKLIHTLEKLPPKRAGTTLSDEHPPSDFVPSMISKLQTLGHFLEMDVVEHQLESAQRLVMTSLAKTIVLSVELKSSQLSAGEHDMKSSEASSVTLSLRGETAEATRPVAARILNFLNTGCSLQPIYSYLSHLCHLEAISTDEDGVNARQRLHELHAHLRQQCDSSDAVSSCWLEYGSSSLSWDGSTVSCLFADLDPSGTLPLASASSPSSSLTAPCSFSLMFGRAMNDLILLLDRPILMTEKSLGACLEQSGSAAPPSPPVQPASGSFTELLFGLNSNSSSAGHDLTSGSHSGSSSLDRLASSPAALKKISFHCSVFSSTFLVFQMCSRTPRPLLVSRVPLRSFDDILPVLGHFRRQALFNRLLLSLLEAGTGKSDRPLSSAFSVELVATPPELVKLIVTSGSDTSRAVIVDVFVSLPAALGDQAPQLRVECNSESLSKPDDLSKLNDILQTSFSLPALVHFINKMAF